jgi:hypothetical protein
LSGQNDLHTGREAFIRLINIKNKTMVTAEQLKELQEREDALRMYL